MKSNSSYKPLTPETWSCFEQVMGSCQGGDSGCWCTWWRLSRGHWQELGKDGRKQYFKKIVQSDISTGIIGFLDNEPYGWCAIAPTENYPVAIRSPIINPSLKKGDWYISCFFIKSGYRRRGLMSNLLRHAVDFAKNNKARAVEACPRNYRRGKSSGEFFVGKTSIFLANNFKQVGYVNHDRPLLRLDIFGG